MSSLERSIMFKLEAIRVGLTDLGKTVEAECQSQSSDDGREGRLTDDISVNKVGQEDGSRLHAVLLGDLQDSLFLHQWRAGRSQRRVGLENNAVIEVISKPRRV
jgi:hypothetical protein